ncbi:hypothetical protein BDZ85DRAFT_267021 [Elsinoe ampelina]|uniref:Uncharacterized protein n=1 Tax=Elsinoe ampelina TaxID=302913 RepID=A0A6A6G560_9PEZI|nr:hypothetical protein BDZ85DRAFT_267021 [Elsinoe ampelina]
MVVWYLRFFYSKPSPWTCSGMVYDDTVPEIVRPNVQTLGYEHDWALSIFDMVFLLFEYDAINNADPEKEPDPTACHKVAVDLLCLIPAFRLYWNDDEEALDEVCRQVQLQVCILGRTLLFITKQIPHTCREHTLMAALHTTMFAMVPTEYMPERFVESERLCDWVKYWIEHSLTNRKSPDPENLPPAAALLAQSLPEDHLPSRNIWLFDSYLSPLEHANLMALSARVHRATRNPLLQLDAQATIERTLCHPHSTQALDALVPGAATYFLHAFMYPGRPEDMLNGWYDVCMPFGEQDAPGEKFRELTSEEARWWAFFKDKFSLIRMREDVAPLTRDYAETAMQRMNWLDGGTKIGFWEGLKQKVGVKKTQAKL